MTVNDPNRIDVADDVDNLLMVSVSEVDGQPVLHAVFTLKDHRQYDPDVQGILLNGMPPRWLVPLHPYTDEDTQKQQAISKQAAKLTQQVVTAAKPVLEQLAGGETPPASVTVPPETPPETPPAPPPTGEASTEQTSSTGEDTSADSGKKKSGTA